jgi:hypothetical protein
MPKLPTFGKKGPDTLAAPDTGHRPAIEQTPSPVVHQTDARQTDDGDRTPDTSYTPAVHIEAPNTEQASTVQPKSRKAYTSAAVQKRETATVQLADKRPAEVRTTPKTDDVQDVATLREYYAGQADPDDPKKVRKDWRAGLSVEDQKVTATEAGKVVPGGRPRLYRLVECLYDLDKFPVGTFDTQELRVLMEEETAGK